MGVVKRKCGYLLLEWLDTTNREEEIFYMNLCFSLFLSFLFAISFPFSPQLPLRSHEFDAKRNYIEGFVVALCKETVDGC